MNIFHLDKSPLIAARYLCDKHVVSQTKETAQMLATAHRVLDGYEKIVMRSGKTRKRFCLDTLVMHNAIPAATHVNHPCNVWLRASTKHYTWTYNHFLSLLSEFAHRKSKAHKYEYLIPFLANVPEKMEDNGWLIPPLVMPIQYHTEDYVQSYRAYYKAEKFKFAVWTNREKPDWWREQ